MKNIIFFFVILCFSCTSKKSGQVDGESGSIPYISPASLKIDTLILHDLSEKITVQFYPNIHSLLIVKDGFLVYEEYFSGNDQNFGRDLGIVQHTDTVLHDLRSITKSIISALIGIAIDQGLLSGVDQKISDFFPEFKFEGKKGNWTIKHFLTMTTGLVWNEKVPYDNPENDEIQMTRSKDPVKYVLDKPLESAPGTKFNYSGGATQILAEIIERSSKTTIDKFAQMNLFVPLGIQHFEWNKFSAWDGADKFVAPSGLRLTSASLMKIGLLYRNKGIWEGKQLLDPKWISESFKAQIEFPSKVSEGKDGYGYQFWMWPDYMLGKPIRIVTADGNGGQNIYWDLGNDLIVVSTAGNYNSWNIENDNYAILKNHIYPAIGKAQIKNSR